MKLFILFVFPVLFSVASGTMLVLSEKPQMGIFLVLVSILVTLNYIFWTMKGLLRSLFFEIKKDVKK